jgi:hypothetical protein
MRSEILTIEYYEASLHITSTEIRILDFIATIKATIDCAREN